MSDENENENPIDIFELYGQTGLKSMGGEITEEFLNDLKNPKGRRMFREMAENDAIVGAFLYAIKTLVRQVDWTVEPGADNDEARAVAEFVEGALFEDLDRTWTDTISEILSFLVFGFSVHEITYKLRKGPRHESKLYRSKYDDNRIGFRGFPIRSQESIEKWDLDQDDGAVRGVIQVAPPNYNRRYIPADKFLLFRTEAHKNNPEGRSVLRNAYISYYYKKKIATYEAIGVSRDLAGLPCMEVPLQMLSSNASAAEKSVLASMKDMIQRVGRDEYEGLVIPSETLSDGTPSGFRLKLLSAGGRRPIDVNEIIKRYESRILISVMAEFLITGLDGHGSYSLVSNKTSLFAQSLGTYLDSIASQFNAHAIPQLLELNGIPYEYCPSLKYEDVELPELSEFASGIASLVGAGVITPDDALEDHAREFAGLPPVERETARVQEAPEGEGMEDLEGLYGQGGDDGND
jgi:hypothetical protein